MELTDRLHLITEPKLRVAVLTGAGISAESGVPIFRGKGSMWEDEKTLNAAITASARADLFFVIGTSAVVSPARELPLIALKKGATVIEVNREPTPITPLVTLSIRGKAAEILPRLWKELLSK